MIKLQWQNAKQILTNCGGITKVAENGKNNSYIADDNISHAINTTEVEF